MTTTKTASTANQRNTRTRSNTRLDVFYKKNKETYPTDTWVVFVNEDGKRKRPRTFKGYFTRDNVRNAYAQAYGIPIQETRSRRVTNY